MGYKKEYIEYFLKHQSQLFDQPVAGTQEEAADFLEDCMAVVCNSMKEVRSYLKENGVDIAGMTLKDLEEEPEVFALPDGKYMIVEG